MAVNGSLKPTLYAIHFEGTDAFGQKFDIALLPEDARNLLFRLHRVILEQEKMKRRVAAKDGGKVA